MFLPPHIFLLITSVLSAAPLALFAAPPQNFAGFIKIFIDIISALIPVVIGLALLAFLWGVAMMIFHAGDESARTKGKQIMVWGIIALFVMVSVWGFVALLARTFF